MKEIEQVSKNWNENCKFGLVKKIYKEKWNILFDLANIADNDKPVNTKILSNPEHAITRHILYLYSMESLIYADLNSAIRDQDQSKIQYY